LGVFPDTLVSIAQETANSLGDPKEYIEAVLGTAVVGR
jgi:hypothetical protein